MHAAGPEAITVQVRYALGCFRAEGWFCGGLRSDKSQRILRANAYRLLDILTSISRLHPQKLLLLLPRPPEYLDAFRVCCVVLFVLSWSPVVYHIVYHIEFAATPNWCSVEWPATYGVHSSDELCNTGHSYLVLILIKYGVLYYMASPLERRFQFGGWTYTM